MLFLQLLLLMYRKSYKEVQMVLSELTLDSLAKARSFILDGSSLV